MTKHKCTLSCGWKYGDPVPECVGELQSCIDDAYSLLLAGLLASDENNPWLIYEVINHVMKRLGQHQMSVG